MQGATRKVVQAISYEALALLFVSPAIAWVYGDGLASSTTLAIILASAAVAWNMVFNTLFEHWEARQQHRQRTLLRRALHTIGLEGGLTVMLTPVISFWLAIGLMEALVASLGLLAFFFVYSFVFQWAFDWLFDVPDSAKACSA